MSGGVWLPGENAHSLELPGTQSDSKVVVGVGRGREPQLWVGSSHMVYWTHPQGSHKPPLCPLPPTSPTRLTSWLSLLVAIAHSLEEPVFGSSSVTLTFHPPSSFPSQSWRLCWGLFLQAPSRGSDIMWCPRPRAGGGALRLRVL